MDKLLTKWLEQKGVKTPDDLDNSPMPDGSPNERETFENYRQGLDMKEVTVINIKNFCKGYMSHIESKWADYDLDAYKKAELIPYHTVYKAIVNLIESPKSNRETMKNQLKQLTK